MTLSSVKPGNDVRSVLVRVGLLALLLTTLPVPVFSAPASSLDRARQELESGRLEEAHRLAEAALRQNPRNPRAHLVFGTVLLLEGRGNEAEKSFEFALGLDPSLRPDLGRVYLDAAKHFVGLGEPETAEVHALRAMDHDPELREPAGEALLAEALARLRAGEAEAGSLVTRWLEQFPGYVPRAEEDVFSLASYYEDSGARDQAKRLYARCAQEFPDGELGRRAATLLQPRRVEVDRLLSVPCSAALYVQLRSIELGYDSTTVEAAFVWVPEDRTGSPRKTLRLLPESRIETAGGEALQILTAEGRGRAAKSIDLSSDSLHHLTLELPPVPRDQHQISLVLENDACGASRGWGRHTLRFADLALPEAAVAAGAGAGGAAPRSREISSLHLHNYLIAAGRCTGALVFSSDGISYRADRHGFDLRCDEVVSVGRKIKVIAEDPLGRIGKAGEVATLEIKGRVVTDKGKEKVQTWHFLAEDGTPPALLLSYNPCRRAR